MSIVILSFLFHLHSCTGGHFQGGSGEGARSILGVATELPQALCAALGVAEGDPMPLCPSLMALLGSLPSLFLRWTCCPQAREQLLSTGTYHPRQECVPGCRCVPCGTWAAGGQGQGTNELLLSAVPSLISEISFLRWCFEGLMQIQFNGHQYTTQIGNLTLSIPGDVVSSQGPGGLA